MPTKLAYNTAPVNNPMTTRPLYNALNHNKPLKTPGNLDKP
jgi:hypothetical protein